MNNLDTLLQEFEKELDEWLESGNHSYECASRSEGLECCMDVKSESSYRPNGRKVIKHFITKAYHLGEVTGAEQMIKQFVKEYKTEYDEFTLSLSAGTVYEDGSISHQQKGAENTFAIGMPVYSNDGDELGRLSIGLYKSLDYATKDFDMRIPVHFWRIDGYKGKVQGIKTYYQIHSKKQQEV